MTNKWPMSTGLSPAQKPGRHTLGGPSCPPWILCLTLLVTAEAGQTVSADSQDRPGLQPKHHTCTCTHTRTQIHGTYRVTSTPQPPSPVEIIQAAMPVIGTGRTGLPLHPNLSAVCREPPSPLDPDAAWVCNLLTM